MSGFDPAGLDAEFFPDGDRRSILVVNIGHPGESPWLGRLPRLDYEEAVRHPDPSAARHPAPARYRAATAT